MRHSLFPVAILFAGLTAFAACAQSEEDAVDEAVDSLAADAEDIGDQIQEGVEEAGEAVGEAVEETGEAIEEAAEEVNP